MILCINDLGCGLAGHHTVRCLEQMLDAATAAIARVRDMHDPTNERFCPQCGWDTEAVGAFGPCPTVQTLDEETL